ncbi:hypothetical protein ACFL08_03645 [Patescibacteria group bacterium]
MYDVEEMYETGIKYLLDAGIQIDVLMTEDCREIHVVACLG